MRAVVVHYHLFKNAGTTIDSILDRNFPAEARGDIEGRYPWSSVSQNELLDYTLANPQLSAISSHQVYLPLPRHPDITFLPLVFLRHPIDRFGSVYAFERSQPRDSLSPSVSVARGGGLAAFAEWTVGREATAVCRNFQVARLSGAQHDMRTARATLEDYDHALAHLKDLPFFGLVGSFVESLKGIQYFLRPHFGEIDTAHVIKNVSDGRAATLAERLERIAQELGPTLYRELLEHNALDLMLYREAQRMFADARARQIAETDRAERPQGVTHRLLRFVGAHRSNSSAGSPLNR